MLSVDERASQKKGQIGDLSAIDIKLKEKAEKKLSLQKKEKILPSQSNASKPCEYLEVSCQKSQKQSVDSSKYSRFNKPAVRLKNKKNDFVEKARFKREADFNLPLEGLKKTCATLMSSTLPKSTKFFSPNSDKSLLYRKELKIPANLMNRYYRSKITPFRKQPSIEISRMGKKQDAGVDSFRQFNGIRDVMRRSYSDPSLRKTKQSNVSDENNGERFKCDWCRNQELVQQKTFFPDLNPQINKPVKTTYLTGKGDSVIQEYIFFKPTQNSDETEEPISNENIRTDRIMRFENEEQSTLNQSVICSESVGLKRGKHNKGSTLIKYKSKSFRERFSKPKIFKEHLDTKKGQNRKQSPNFPRRCSSAPNSPINSKQKVLNDSETLNMDSGAIRNFKYFNNESSSAYLSHSTTNDQKVIQGHV